MGAPWNRVHGVQTVLRKRAASARVASEVDGCDPHAAAALRGKAVAYTEAADLVRRLEFGHRLRKKQKWEDQ